MGYGFDIAEGTARTMWCASDGSSTYYMGQLVSFTAASKAQMNGTVVPLAVPAGAWDTTNFQVVAGIVVGFSDRSQVFNSTYGQYRAGVVTQALQLARDWYNAGMGMYAVGDPQLLLEVALVDPTTLLRGYLAETDGSAPTVVTDTAGSATGYTSAGTTTACLFTPVANTCSIFCRTGANMGLYRVTSDTSTTAPAVTTAFPYDPAIGDTFVRASVKQGYSLIYISGPGLWINNQLSGGTTNYFGAIVYKLDLRDAGNEHCIFKFDPIHFTNIRS